MKPTTTLLAALATLAVAACGTTPAATPPPKPGVITMYCVEENPTTGVLKLEEDEECENNPNPHEFWLYGGTLYVTGGKTYVRGGSRAMPNGVLLKVRPAGKGGHSVTVGRVNRLNDSTNRALQRQAAQATQPPAVPTPARTTSPATRPGTPTSAPKLVTTGGFGGNVKTGGFGSTTGRR